MINDDTAFEYISKAFYNNGDCNSVEEYENDLNKISFIANHFSRIDAHDGETNFNLLINHFIGFINCFGIMSEQLLKYRIPDHHEKINALFVMIGTKQFDGTFSIDEEFSINLKKGITNG